jgi:outer membrane receptor protein involved in Fe transport
VQNISPSNGGAYLKYNGSGTLHGFSANIGVTYVERTPTESPNAGDPAAAPNGVQAPNSTNQWALTVPSFTLWNLGASYTWGGGSSKFDHTIRLNVNNVFDRDYLKVNKNIGDARGIYVTYTLGLMPR